MEFCDELECFIAGHVDNNTESSIDVTEFETLTHHLLGYCEQYTVISDEYQRTSNTVMDDESTVQNIDHRSYDMSGLESILLE